MTQEQSEIEKNPFQNLPRPPVPDPALKRLDRLVGAWTITGRTLGSPEDNISGQVTIEWLPGGFFQQQRGEIQVPGFRVEAVEILGYDPSTGTFPSTVYSNVGPVPTSYGWNVQGDTVTHWTQGSMYTGTFSADGRTLTGGWRPVGGQGVADDTAYDSIMTRID